MTEEEVRRHERMYKSYFGYSHLTNSNKYRLGALTEESKQL